MQSPGIYKHSPLPVLWPVPTPFPSFGLIAFERKTILSVVILACAFPLWSALPAFFIIDYLMDFFDKIKYKILSHLIYKLHRALISCFRTLWCLNRAMEE